LNYFRSRGVFIRLRLNTLQLAAGMKGEVNRAEAYQSEGGLIPPYHCHGGVATAQFRFDTPQLAAGSFIKLSGFKPTGHKMVTES
jgi:hypothetical protein